MAEPSAMGESRLRVDEAAANQEPGQGEEDDTTNEGIPPINSSGSRLDTRSGRAIVFGTASSLIAAICAITLIAVTLLLGEISRLSYYLNYNTRDTAGSVIGLAVLALLISAFNHHRLRLGRPMSPLSVNLLLDFIIFVIEIPNASVGISYLASYSSGGCGYNGGQEDRICERYRIAATVIAYFAMGAGLILGIIHLVLFLVRCRMAARSEYWKKPWNFRSGELSFEVSVKFAREPLRGVPEESLV